MTNRIACCGLDCQRCDAYRATKNNDRALREKTAELWSRLNHVTVLPEQIDCEGCRADGVKTAYCESLCAIRRCVVQKGFATCGGCADRRSCRTLGAVAANNPEVLANLEQM